MKMRIIGEKQFTGPNMIQKMNEKMKLIRKRIKSVQDRQDSYVDRRQRPLEFQNRR